MRGHVSRIRWVVPMVAVASLTLPGVAQANHSLTEIVSTGPAGGNGAMALVSTGPDGGNGSFNAIFDGVSKDGSRVFFDTSESLVSADTDISRDVYQRSGGTTTWISAGAINGNGNFDAYFNGASDDGTHVFFSTDEPLASTDTDPMQDLS